MSDLEKLCLSCGMCCDGTLLKRGLLKPEEVEPARKHGLRVFDDGSAFHQPCSRSKDRTCQIYEHRPSVCRSFVCKLWARHRDEGGPLEPRLEAVRRVRELLALMKDYGLTRSEDGTEVSFSAEGGDAFEAMGAFGELMTLIEEDFSIAPPVAPTG